GVCMFAQETPEPGKADRLTEPPKVRPQDLRPVALPLPSLPDYMQIGPRVDSVSRALSVCCCLVVGRWLAEETPGESLAPYHPTPPPLQTRLSLPDNSTLDTMLPPLDTQPWPTGTSRALPAECFRTRPPPAWRLRGSTMPLQSIVGYSRPRPESLAVLCGEIEWPRQDFVQGARRRTVTLRAWPRLWRGIVSSAVVADSASATGTGLCVGPWRAVSSVARAP